MNKEDLIWSLLSPKTTAIKQECNGVHFHRLPITVSIHELLQLCVSLDPEEHFIPILKEYTTKLAG
jgi:hypothetical protein